jgi:hypothetical protein
MDTSIVTALAALAGSLIGGLTTLASTWLTQRYQATRERTANEIAKREALYGEFINEATRVGIDAIQREIGSMAELTRLVALTNRIRLASSDEVLAAADAVIVEIAELYMGTNKTLREIYERRAAAGIRRPTR